MSTVLSGLAVIDALKSGSCTPKTIIGYAPAETEMPILRPFRPDGRVLKSELPDVADDAWTDFVFVMKVASLGSISPSNGLGMFDVRYKRLADLGLVTNLSYKRDPVINRSVQVAEWLPPNTREQFLKSASLQYKVFAASTRAYFKGICNGTLCVPPDVSASGALAILQRGGRAALAKWSDPNQQQFEATRALFHNANGIF